MKKTILSSFAILALFFTNFSSAEAHVRYLVDKTTVDENSGLDINFLLV